MVRRDARIWVTQTAQAHPPWCLAIAFTVAFTESFVGQSFYYLRLRRAGGGHVGGLAPFYGHQHRLGDQLGLHPSAFSPFATKLAL